MRGKSASQDIDAIAKLSYFSPSVGKILKFLLVITEAKILLNQRFIVLFSLGTFWGGGVMVFYLLLVWLVFLNKVKEWPKTQLNVLI